MNPKRSRFRSKVACIFMLLAFYSYSQPPTGPYSMTHVDPIPVQPVPVTTVDPNQPPQPSPQAGSPAAVNTQPSSPLTNKDEQDPSESGDIYRTTIFLMSSGEERGSKLENYNVSNLNDAQKEVDRFIREKAELGDTINLTKAKGNGKQFQYQYQNNTQNSCQSWAISVSLADNNIPAQSNSSTGASTAQQPADKYAITGLNYVENNKLSQQEKQELEDKMKKRQEEIEKYKKQFEQQMEMMQKMDWGIKGSQGPFGWIIPFGYFDSWY